MSLVSLCSIFVPLYSIIVGGLQGCSQRRAG